MMTPLTYALAGAVAYAILRRVYARLSGEPSTQDLQREIDRLRQKLAADRTTTGDSASLDRVATLAKAGNKIAAIRDYRQATGATLEQAKAYVEELDSDRPG